MKNIILVLALFILSSNLAYSEEAEKMEADEAYVMSIVRAEQK